MNMKECDKRKSHISSKLHMIYEYVSSNNITKTPHTIAKTPPHTLTYTLQNRLKQPQHKLQQPQFKIYPNELVTIQSSTLSISSPYCTWHFYPQVRLLNSLHLT
jgi:GTP cyclohydrolase I